jgi:hypothetical protein
MKCNFLEYDYSVQLAKEFAETNSIVWDPLPKQDTVNENVSKLVQSAEKDNEFDNINDYRGLSEVRNKTGGWMFEIFGHETPLYMSWIVKYSPSSNVGTAKIEGSLTKHTDGSSKTGDLCAVVYTLHHGTIMLS